MACWKLQGILIPLTQIRDESHRFQQPIFCHLLCQVNENKSRVHEFLKQIY